MFTIETGRGPVGIEQDPDGKVHFHCLGRVPTTLHPDDFFDRLTPAPGWWGVAVDGVVKWRWRYRQDADIKAAELRQSGFTASVVRLPEAFG